MAKVLEFGSMLFLGILLVLAFTHLLNGTFSSWIGSKFTTHDLNADSSAKEGTASNTTADSSGGGGGRPNLVY